MAVSSLSLSAASSFYASLCPNFSFLSGKPQLNFITSVKMSPNKVTRWGSGVRTPTCKLWEVRIQPIIILYSNLYGKHWCQHLRVVCKEAKPFGPWVISITPFEGSSQNSLTSNYPMLKDICCNLATHKTPFLINVCEVFCIVQYYKIVKLKPQQVINDLWAQCFLCGGNCKAEFSVFCL